MIYYCHTRKTEEKNRMEKKQYLDCAEIVGTHGVRGGMRLQSRADSPEALTKLKRLFLNTPNGWREWKVARASVQKSMVLIWFHGIDTLEAALPYKGKLLYAHRDDIRLPKGQHFIADMLGLPVLDAETGENYGTLDDVNTAGVQELYTVKKADGGTFMIPAVPAFIVKVSVDEETDGCAPGVYVRLIEGMME